MRIVADFHAIHDVRSRELVLRFLFGGFVTVVAGLIAEKFGPKIGGLFLAFPAILPASITLVQKHTMRQQRKHGTRSRMRARKAAALDSFGAALGGVGLLTFALTTWQLLPHTPPWLALLVASIGWAASAFLVWKGSRKWFRG